MLLVLVGGYKMYWIDMMDIVFDYLVYLMVGGVLCDGVVFGVCCMMLEELVFI